MTEKLLNLIQRYEEEGDFYYAELSDDGIKKAEGVLEFKLDSLFVSFVKKFGFGGVGGVEIYGVAANQELVFLTETLEYRKCGLPNNLLVIENVDEYLLERFQKAVDNLD